jgi:hypothetical protein
MATKEILLQRESLTKQATPPEPLIPPSSSSPVYRLKTDGIYNVKERSNRALMRLGDE